MKSEINPRIVRKHFNRAAQTYDGAAALQREVGARLLENLDYLKIAPHSILDLGCGTGGALAALRARYPQAQLVALDFAEAMLRKAAPAPSRFGKLLGRKAVADAVCADFAQLPLKSASVDLIVSNFALHWAADLPAVIAECARVLRVGGVFLFSYAGPDSLRELRKIAPQVHAFPDMHDIGDLLIETALADPVMARDDITLTYPTAQALFDDLKRTGHTFAGTSQSPRGLMGKHAHAARLAAINAPDPLSTKPAAQIALKFEVITGHAWKVAAKTTADGHAIVQFNPKARGR